MKTGVVGAPSGRKDEKDLLDMSESDEEYFPDQGEEEEFLGKRKEFLGISKQAKDLFKRLAEEREKEVMSKLAKVRLEHSLGETQKIEVCFEAVKELAKQIKPSKEGVIHFAGKLYKLSASGELEETNTNDVRKGFEELQELAKKYTTEDQQGKLSQTKGRNLEEEEYRQILREKKNNLRTLIGLLNNRHRNVSAIFKSKIDWKRYTSSNQLEKQFSQNRKDGFIEKQKFLIASGQHQKKS